MDMFYCYEDTGNLMTVYTVVLICVFLKQAKKKKKKKKKSPCQEDNLEMILTMDDDE